MNKEHRFDWTKLFADYGSRVFGHALLMTKNEQDAHDLSQETWVTGMKHQRQVKHPELILAWLLNIQKRTFINWVNRGKLRLRKVLFTVHYAEEANNANLLAEGEGELDNYRPLFNCWAPSHTVTKGIARPVCPVRTLTTRERLRLIRSHVALHVTPEESELLWFSIGHSLEEIAERFGISTAAANARLYRLRLRLKKVLHIVN